MTAQLRVRLRAANTVDAAQLLAWRNEPTTRDASFSGAEVGAGEHARWLAERLNDPDCRLWIAMDEDAPVGQVRLDRLPGGQAEISISVAPEHRQRGYGVEMLAAAGHAVSREAFAKELVARVKPGNAASLTLFAKAGYRTARRDPSEVVLVARPSPR